MNTFFTGIFGALVLCCVLFTGCATLPRAISIPPDEELKVRDAFSALHDGRQDCFCCLDGFVTIRFHSLLQSAAVSGYMQAQKPSSLKFVAENPFGQPLVIFATNGSEFSYSVVMEQQYYAGLVSSKTYGKYAPSGFQADHGFYWIAGRLWPEAYTVTGVGRQEDGPAYWIKLGWHETKSQSYVLYDIVARQILRHILVDAEGTIQLEVEYGNYQKVEGSNAGDICRLPGLVRIKAKEHNGQLELVFREWLASESFPETDFIINYPANFTKIEVQ